MAKHKKTNSKALAPATGRLATEGLLAALGEFDAAVAGIQGRLDALAAARPKRRGTGALTRRTGEIKPGSGALRLTKGELPGLRSTGRILEPRAGATGPVPPLERVVPAMPKKKAREAIAGYGEGQDEHGLESAFSEAYEAHAQDERGPGANL